jgi:serine/threonine protein phosphatase PrpC
MSADHHADERDRKRRRRRYGHTTTNPGMRIVMRELARKDKEDGHPPEVSPAISPGQRRIRIKRRRKKH